uniref:Beta-lactamase n=1 Tax=Meloidogyne hapla TaxID=6305 RepID=A0A1I8B9V6_MELHA
MFSSLKSKFKKSPDLIDNLEGGLTPEEMQKERLEYVQNIGIEYRYGCYEEKQAVSCQLLGEYLEAVEKKYEEAFNIFSENCEKRKWPRSCYKCATYYLAGRATEASYEKAFPPLEIACNGNIPKACRRLSQLYWRSDSAPNNQPNTFKAVELMRKSCELEDYQSCWTLSNWYLGPNAKFAKRKTKRGITKETGIVETGSIEKDGNKALEYGLIACDNGNILEACANISRMYNIGDGIPKDEEK